MPVTRNFAALSMAFGVATVTACALLPQNLPAPSTGSPPRDASGQAVPESNRVTLQGTVRIPGQADASGVQVSAVPVAAPPGVETYAAVTDAAGRFAIAVPDATYNLVARKPGTPWRAVKWQVQAVTPVDIDLVPTGTIKGKVTATGVADLTGTQVFVPGTDIQGTADASGSYTLGEVPIGKYSLAAQRAGFAFAKIDNVDVTAGGTASGKDIALTVTAGGAGTGTIVGVANVTACDGSIGSAGGATITVKSADGSTKTATSANDGKFEATGVAGPIARVTVSKPGYADAVALSVIVFAGESSDTGALTLKPTVATCPQSNRVSFTKLAIDAAGTSRSIDIKNGTAAIVDLTQYAISYEAKSGSNNALAMVHARIVDSGGATVSIPPGGNLTFVESVGCSSGNCIKLESSLGNSAGVNKLGIQAGHGSLVLYNAVAVGASITTGTMIDYLQYGNLTQGANSDPYTHAAAAVSAKLWESTTATASAPGGLATSISAITAGATGSANWKKD
jgi:hypothetical protein